MSNHQKRSGAGLRATLNWIEFARHVDRCWLHVESWATLQRLIRPHVPVRVAMSLRRPPVASTVAGAEASRWQGNWVGDHPPAASHGHAPQHNNTSGHPAGVFESLPGTGSATLAAGVRGKVSPQHERTALTASVAELVNTSRHARRATPTNADGPGASAVPEEAWGHKRARSFVQPLEAEFRAHQAQRLASTRVVAACISCALALGASLALTAGWLSDASVAAVTGVVLGATLPHSVAAGLSHKLRDPSNVVLQTWYDSMAALCWLVSTVVMGGAASVVSR